MEPPKAVKKFSTLFKSIFIEGVQPLLYSSVGDKASFDPFQKQVEYYTEDLKRYRKVAKVAGDMETERISSTWRAPRQQRRNMKTVSRGAAIFDQYLVFSGTQDQRKGSYRSKGRRSSQRRIATVGIDSRRM